MSAFLIEVTDRCNLSCAFCYRAGETRAELTDRELRHVIENVLGTPDATSVVLIGGEPLMRRELLPLVASVHQQFPRVRIGMATNGHLLDESMIEMLVRAGVERLEIPLFTLEPARYEALTGHGGLERVRRGIRKSRCAGLGVTVGVVLLRETIDELAGVIETAVALGAEDVALFRFVPHGVGAAHAERFTPTPSELRSWLARADEIVGQLGVHVTVMMPPGAVQTGHTYQNLSWGHCGRGIEKWVVDTQGDLLACELNRVRIGSLLIESAGHLMGSEAARQVAIRQCGVCGMRPA